MDKIRVDKWLWTVRMFKSRTMASDAVKGGRVKINGAAIKASYNIGRGEVIELKKNGFYFQFKVIELLKNRVADSIAITCYENLTPPEELNKYNEWFVGKGGIEFRERGAGRPTKKDRREIDGFKDDWFDVEFDDES